MDDRRMKRSSWLDVLIGMAGTEHVPTPEARRVLAELDDVLFGFWRFGENIILAWTREGEDFRFLAIRYERILDIADTDYINGLLAGPKFHEPAVFAATCARLGSGVRIAKTSHPGAAGVPDDLIDSCVAKYGVTLDRERAVVLLDIVGFSLHTPLEQVAMLKRLSHSVNSAYSQLVSKDIRISFARSTTGDGFYIWNRAKTRDANTALYKLMMLLLADNAVVQRTMPEDFPSPRLRAAFHVGEHYEFHEVEAPSPATFSYIVGPVTIELARFISGASAEQIVIGEFDTSSAGGASVSTQSFVRNAAASLDELSGLRVTTDHIANIRCYLTGPATPDGQFTVASYVIRDKHGIEHSVYNAKINIHLRGSDPIFLGIQHKDIDAH